jgi:UDP-N-acetylglucosamine--N-acetylmuramyl-(pentapeptide) pyrophosphoryl-undecaprenol N-acetylglucosamine transferase
LFPGLAVAECLTAGGDDAVLFVGSSYGIEARVIPQTRFGFRELPVRGLRGRGWRGALGLIGQVPAAIIRAWRILGEFGADMVLGLGGYASFPVVIAASMRRIPSVLLEQNARPGLANRVLSRFAARVCATFPESADAFPHGKVVVTGNPVRVLGRPSARKETGFTLLVFGGSQGAHRINEAMMAAAPALKESIPNLHILHQTGATDAEAVRARYAEIGVSAEVEAFIDDMASAYARADLVLCRAGATTVAELALLGKPAILVPYPFAADDHQRANASVVEARGAGIMILDRDLTGERLAATIAGLARGHKRLESMAEAAKHLAVPDAAERVVEVCRKVVREVRADG